MTDEKKIARRRFLTAGAALTGAVTLAGCAHTRAPADPGPKPDPPPPEAAEQPADGDAEEPEDEDAGEAKIRKYNRLGRTGFQVSDISMGCGRIAEPDVVRYAFDHGINYLDTAETYGNGDSERTIGEAMPNLRREELFISTKLVLKPNEAAASIVQRLGKCLERLKTEHVDALYMHSITDKAMLNHAGFHKAFKELRAAGKVRFCGVSSHGPRGEKGDSMEDVLCAAAADGRFDLMLLVYNYLNHAAGQKVLDACKAKDVGVTLMKTAPALLTLPTLDPKALTDEQEMLVKLLAGRGMNRKAAIAYMQKRYTRMRTEQGKRQGDVDSFVARHGVKTEDDLAHRSVQWVLRNPDVHTVCVSLPDFDALNAYLPLSARALTVAELRQLEHHAAASSNLHCRVGCTDCAGACPRSLPASTIMRYSYYFQQQGREKLAMQKYAALAGGSDPCAGCDGRPCSGACPHGVDVQLQLSVAHRLLSLEGLA